MNVCIVTSSYPANPDDVAAPFAADLARAIQTRGHRVTVIAPERTGVEVFTGGVAVAWIPRHGRRGALVQTRVTSPSDIWNAWRLVRDGERLLLRTVREERIDVVFALWAVPAGYIAWRVHKETRVPYGVWALGSDINRAARYPVARSLIKTILRAARWRFANSRLLVQRVKELCAADCDFLPAVRVLPAPARVGVADGVKFVFVGRFEPVKGVDVLVDAASRLGDRDDVHVYLLGGGSLADEMSDRIASCGLQHRVTIVPQPPTDVVAAYLRACDCVVIPSRQESLPVVFAEAVQVGTPVLVTDTGDLGLLAAGYGLTPAVPPGDAAALAGAMRAFAADPSGARRAFEEARPRLLELFDVDAGAGRLLAAFAGA
jgi:glycosyltransferase involved in cell wall biosynthesis